MECGELVRRSGERTGSSTDLHRVLRGREIMPLIEISDENMVVLKQMAEPFVDTPDSVIGRLIDALGLRELEEDRRSTWLPRSRATASKLDMSHHGDDGWVSRPQAGRPAGRERGTNRRPTHVEHKPRRRISTTRLSAIVADNTLILSMGDDSVALPLPATENVEDVREMTYRALKWVATRGATNGQQNAVRKKLNEAGFYLGKPGRGGTAFVRHLVGGVDGPLAE